MKPLMIMRFQAAALLVPLAASPGALAGTTADPLRIPGAAPKSVPNEKPPETGKAGQESGAAMQAAAPPMSDAQKYCQNIAAAAADARFAWQSRKLADAEGQIKQRIADLEAKQAEVKDILTRYDDAMKRAKADLVDIYAHMPPETAAAQLSALDDAAAAAILAQLKAQKASAILNEIAPERAVRLVNTISNLVPPADGKKS